ncbi:MAG TPA: peptidoglycan editing factor PgeF [Candidatus Acidoferrales bacterium]|nr:peptidoglycan editing factor PgeF [Candidatus Acidoferrales bacterium]
MSRISTPPKMTRRQPLESPPGLPPEWSLVRRRGIAVLRAKPFERISWLVHGFSTRLGGASSAHGRRALNLGYLDWDERDRVDANRQLLARAVGARAMELVAMRQFHSSVVRVVERAAGHRLGGDALATRAPRLLLAVQTADCLPILLVDPRRHVAAAIHAGWRGTLARIAEKTVGELRMDFGTRPRDVLAAIGPAIGACCYEVGPEVAQAYAARFHVAGEWFDERFEALSTGDEPTPFLWLQQDPPGHARPKRARLDLVAANSWQLANAGLLPERVFACRWCTACHPDWLFSYRREGGRTGRQMAVIGWRR